MHSLGNSLRKRLHSILASPRKARKEWGKQYWQELDGIRNISCRHCPKFNEQKITCTIPFGTPLRKCVIAATEAHLSDARDKNVLEIGFGRLSLGRNLVNRSGGTWTGVEPHQPKERKPQLGKGGYGHAEDIPFPDNTFDMVFGIQSFEHWGQKAAAAARKPSEYSDCLNEIRRVLKPGGAVYLDAPMHFHGHEMFIMGDIQKIASLFPDEDWCNVVIEKWRYDYEPLERYAPTEKLFDEWQEEIFSYDAVEVERVKAEPIWLFTISAEKK
ncbi:MAG: class I SAM-dependent methyltransferase [Gammaproteobacteria bacterium]|nr:class I SAM-dependent methyltransferase [Gammaproteobacteria bacterium]